MCSSKSTAARYARAAAHDRDARAYARTVLKKRLESGALPQRKGFKKSHDESDCPNITYIVYMDSKNAARAKKYVNHEFTMKPRKLNF